MGMRFRIGFLAAAAIPALSACVSVRDRAPAQADGVLSEFAAGVQPGCVMGRFGPGERIEFRAGGYDRLVDGQPLNERTRFLVASMSKQFTALSVLILSEQGKLRLDDRASRWVPELRNAVGDATILELLNQTAGVRDHVNLLFLSGAAALKQVDRAQTFVLLARQRSTNFPPGTRAQYSNGNYFVLAEIVERASGRTLAAFARREIFAPIGMTRSGFLDGREPGALADGHEPQEDGGGFRIANDRPATNGSGGLVTTVADLARFERAFRAGARPWGAALKNRFLTPGRLRNGETAILPEFGTAYGTGVGLSPVGADLQIAHDGGAEGFRSQYVRMRDAPLGVAVLCNRVDADASALAKTALQQLRGEASSVASESPARSTQPQTASSAPVLPAPELLEGLSGVYRADELDTVYRLKAVDGGFEVVIRSPYTSTAGDTETWGGLVLESPGVLRSGPLRLRFTATAGKTRIDSLSFGKRVEGIVLARMP